jgi:hypothetical protein
MVQLWRQLPRRALPHLAGADLTSSLGSDQQPPPLDGLAPIYDYLHRRLKECFASSFDSVSGSSAAASASHLVSPYLQSPPSAPLRLFALHRNSGTAQGGASVP